jgi:hypothetical protein
MSPNTCYLCSRSVQAACKGGRSGSDNGQPRPDGPYPPPRADGDRLDRLARLGADQRVGRVQKARCCKGRLERCQKSITSRSPATSDVSTSS